MAKNWGVFVKRLTKIMSLLTSDVGLGKMGLIGIGVGILAAGTIGYVIFAGGQPEAPTKKTGDEATTTTSKVSDSSEITVPLPSGSLLTSEEEAMFNEFGEDFGAEAGGLVKGVREQFFTAVDAPVNGDLTDSGLELARVYGGTFTFGSEDVAAVKAWTGIQLNPGDHSLFITQTAAPPANSAIDYQLGFGLRPGGAPASAGTPDANEPIARDPHSYAVFAFPEGWQEVQVLDVANNWTPLQEKGIMFFDPDNVFGAFIVPQRFVGKAGEPGILTVQVFGRQTPAGQSPSLEDPVGVSGGTFEFPDLPDPLPAPIFADGFESGDVSAWSGVYDTQAFNSFP